MEELLILEKLIAGLKAGKELHHEEWEEGEYTILVDGVLKDENGKKEQYIFDFRLEDYYFTEPQPRSNIVFVYEQENEEFITVKKFTKAEFINKFPDFTFIRFLEE